MAFAMGATSQDTNSVLSYESSCKSKDILPKINKSGGQEFVRNTFSAVNDLSDLKFNAKLPSNINDPNYWKNISFELKNPNKSLPINIIPEESHMQSVNLSNGNTMRWGAITGEISFIKNKPQTVVIGVVEIPAEQKASFTFALHADNENPPVALEFGNLEPSKEIMDVILSNRNSDSLNN
ncbi:MAG: hypothetical protein C0594_00675 [Marinilabiliales bacterium]|nr:MAG: hypothetical protein C0594_00675 [Marinilabiliales bacterium]